MKFKPRLFLASVILLSPLTSCKSHWVSATVQNKTGVPIHELEVDYPTASFGNNVLAPDDAMHYRFKIRGSGPVKVSFTLPDGSSPHIQGPVLTEQQDGTLLIRLLPAGKADFSPNLRPAS